MLPGRKQKLPSDRLPEIAVRLLHQQAILEIENVAAERQLVGIAGLAQKQRRLTDQVESEIGEGQVDLERRRVPAPFAQPLAEDQRVIAEPLQVVDARRVRRRHICFTSSGMS